MERFETVINGKQYIFMLERVVKGFWFCSAFQSPTTIRHSSGHNPDEAILNLVKKLES